jgi:hypothetical protein
MEKTPWENSDDLFQYETVKTVSKKKSATHDEPPPPPKKPAIEQCGLVSRQQEHNELGSPDLRSGCYGCCYVGEQEAGAVPIEELMNLMTMIRKSIAKTDQINLAMHVAQKYETIRTRINQNLMYGEKPLPEWRAATILQHLRMHNTDPELQTWSRMVELQELAQVALNASVVRNSESGEIRLDAGQTKLYLELNKQIESLSKTDVTTKLYYSGGNHLDMKAASEGPISYSGKTLISMWGKKPN